VRKFTTINFLIEHGTKYVVGIVGCLLPRFYYLVDIVVNLIIKILMCDGVVFSSRIDNLVDRRFDEVGIIDRDTEEDALYLDRHIEGERSNSVGFSQRHAPTDQIACCPSDNR